MSLSLSEPVNSRGQGSRVCWERTKKCFFLNRRLIEKVCVILKLSRIADQASLSGVAGLEVARKYEARAERQELFTVTSREDKM